MAAKRKALGKGLSALIPEDLEKEDYERIREIDIDLISPNPNQPAGFEQDKLDELTESIKIWCHPANNSTKGRGPLHHNCRRKKVEGMQKCKYKDYSFHRKRHRKQECLRNSLD